MIDVTPFIEKLDMLKEYIGEKVNSFSLIECWMDLQVCPTEWYIKIGEPIPKPYKKTFHIYIINTFDEWLETRTHKAL